MTEPDVVGVRMPAHQGPPHPRQNSPLSTCQSHTVSLARARRGEAASGYRPGPQHLTGLPQSASRDPGLASWEVRRFRGGSTK